jgi:two-component system, NtrC family, sensor kinase
VAEPADDPAARLEAELEAFSYSVSHDLRFPLRVIDGYARALDEDYGAQLDDQARSFIAAIRGGVQRMETMIERVQELSQITRSPLARDDIDVTAMARDELAKLAAGATREVAIEISPGLVAHADRVLLRRALASLLSNAWKFTGRATQARIEVGKTGDTWFVRDNGVGFDSERADRLFAPFRRFHRAEEFPGDGVGLATAQRAIARHGGRIWAESAAGEGATFYFTLP